MIFGFKDSRISRILEFGLWDRELYFFSAFLIVLNLWVTGVACYLFLEVTCAQINHTQSIIDACTAIGFFQSVDAGTQQAVDQHIV